MHSDGESHLLWRMRAERPQCEAKQMLLFTLKHSVHVALDNLFFAILLRFSFILHIGFIEINGPMV